MYDKALDKSTKIGRATREEKVAALLRASRILRSLDTAITHEVLARRAARMLPLNRLAIKRFIQVELRDEERKHMGLPPKDVTRKCPVPHRE